MSQTEVERNRVHVGDTIQHVSDAYSTEKRGRAAQVILNQWANGVGVRELADEANVSEATIRDVLNDYFDPVMPGETAAEQDLITMEGQQQGEKEPPDQEPGHDPARIAEIADWHGISEEAARSVAAAEDATGLDFSRPREEDETPSETAYARAAEMDQPEPEQGEGQLMAYRLGFIDGFETATDRSK